MPVMVRLSTSFFIEVRLPASNDRATFQITQDAHSPEQYDQIAKAFDAGLELSVDACGFWIRNWEDWATSYGSVAAAAAEYLDEEKWAAQQPASGPPE